MTALNFRQLAIISVKDPRQGARLLLSLDVPREVLWTGLALIAVLNAVLFSISNILFPGPVPFPELFNVPLVYCVAVAGALTLTVYAMFWTGRLLGGSGSLGDIMLVFLWLQALRLVVQAVAILLVLTIPLLSNMLFFAASLYGVYMLLHFINEAHGLQSMGRAAGVLVASFLAIVLGLSLLIYLIGGPIIGSSLYV